MGASARVLHSVALFPCEVSGRDHKALQPNAVAKRFPFPRCTKPAKPRCAHDAVLAVPEGSITKPQ